MNKRFITILSCICIIAGMFSISLNAYAEETTLDFEINIQPVVSETQVETEEPTEEETEKETQEQTEKETEKTTEKVTKPNTTEEQTEPEEDEPVWNEDNNIQGNGNEVEKTTEKTTAEETTFPPLPEGQFYVFLQRNNGERILKTVMKREGLVPEPSNPYRKGYIFMGWYSDPKFKNEWNFSRNIAEKEMTIYAKWIADENTVEYPITVKQTAGGVIEVNPAKASLGEIITITIIPDEGKRLVAGSLLVNGEPTDILSFKMPKGNVNVTGSFEDIPAGLDTDENDGGNSFVLIIAGVVIAIAAIVAIIVVLMKRRAIYQNGFDPDGVPEAPEYYDDWIDDTIVVEDGFKEGKIVNENAEPDYGLPDEDEE